VPLNSNFIIRLTSLSATTLSDALPHPTSDLDLKPVPNDYSDKLLVFVPSAMVVESSAASVLTKQAAGLKHDLELLDEQLRLAINEGEAPPFSDPERWFAQHTVVLSSLDPRDVILGLGGRFPHRQLAARVAEHSVTILPESISESDKSKDTFLAADAMERDVLYRRAQKLASEQASGAAPKQGNTTAAGPTTTVKSTTTTKITPPAKGSSTTTAETTTTTETSTAPPSNSGASGSQPAPQASASQSQGASASGTNSNASQGGATGSAGGAAGGGTPAGSQGQGSGGSSMPALKSWPSQKPFPMDRVQRLYHFRHAKAIAAAINKASGSKDVDLVEAIGDDDLLLILPPTSPDGHDPFSDIRRAVATIDLPRPQLSLQVWSYQISSEVKDDQKRLSQVRGSFEEIRERVQTANDRMTLALQNGFRNVLDKAAAKYPNDPNDFFDPVFAGYLTKRYQDCLKENHYCLGYYRALEAPFSTAAGDRVMDASLSRLLLFLIAAKDDEPPGPVPQPTLAKEVIDAMQGGPNIPCKREELAKLGETEPQPLCFTNFSKQLDTLRQKRNLRIFRAALLDFFFQYKQVHVYPNDFVPYDLQNTAHAVDGLFSPIVDGFNEDVDDFVRRTLEVPLRGDEKAKGLVSNSMVQVATISGTQATVSGKVNNYFDITPPMSLSDILNPNQNAATALKGILEPKEITLLTAIANMGSQPRIQAQVSRNATLTITPTALDTASSAELDVNFDVGEPTGAPPGSVNSATARADTLNRVADHQVTTTVRVESLKLFQVSGFTMELTHPKRGTPVPVIGQVWEGLFGTMPGVDKLFHFPNTTKKVDNRSVAIVRAVVVPTAMDLGQSLDFESDRVSDPLTGSTDPIYSMQQIGGKIRPFHKKLMECVIRGKSDCWGCSGIRLSGILEDLK